MKLNLLVIRSPQPELLKQQYEVLGFSFQYHQHGKGPLHYAAEREGLVFEIYPLLSTMDKADASLRLGFELENLSRKMDKLNQSNWKILSEIRATPWGETALVQDLDGRKVELKNK